MSDTATSPETKTGGGATRPRSRSSSLPAWSADAMRAIAASHGFIALCYAAGAPRVCHTLATRMRTSTSIKLAIAAVVALFFAGFVLRAATRLASAAMHSMLMLVVVAVVILWAVWKFR